MDKDITKFLYEDFSTLTKERKTFEKNSTSDGSKDSVVPSEYIQSLKIVENQEDIDNISEAEEFEEELIEDQEEDINVLEPEDRYQEGYNAARVEMEPLLQKKQEDDLIHDLLHQKLLALEISDDFQKEISEQISEVIKIALGHLRKTLPTDFESIFQKELFSIIKKGMKAGIVNINIHPSKKDIVTELIAKNVTENISQIKLLEDDNLNTDDIKVECHNASFEYKSDDIISAIDKMMNEDKN